VADITSVSAPISGTDKTLTFETGRLAQQSQGAVVGQIGETVVLVTANAAKGVREGIDFFPLTVDVEERAYAAGKIPGSFFRREGRPSDLAILTCRLIDRPLRPSFPDGYRNETQVVVTVLGADQENPHDVLAINAASASLMISGIPFDGPIGAVRVAYGTDGEWIAHPTYEEGDASTFELVVAGRELADGDVAIMMVEAGGTERAWQYYEDGAEGQRGRHRGGPRGLEGVDQGVDRTAARPRREGRHPQAARVHAGARLRRRRVRARERGWRVEARACDSPRHQGRAQRGHRKAGAEIAAELSGEFEGREKRSRGGPLAHQEARASPHRRGRQRIDGRGPTDIRPLSAEVGIVPTAHGSGLFQRGETQVLNVCTLGMPRMNQLLDTIGPDTNKRYMHHYNMPPSANGEVGRVGSPKRREIGHGLLAERALLPVVPSQEEFSYTLRLVSEVLASNGSTSMASVCSSAVLMDAGVPIKAPVAGIAMGLVFAEGKYTTLTDILGAEDAFGDMDFKVAGTADFITALQLDTKIDGIPADVLAAALQQARDARMQILEVMHAAIAEPRPEVNETAPKIISFNIPMDKIGEVIGPKGKVINTITQETGSRHRGRRRWPGRHRHDRLGRRWAVAEARRQIDLIINPPSASVGEIYPGKVVNITKFGAFVNILPGRDGLVHISKLGRGKRIERVEDVLELGDEIMVRVDDIDPNGKVSLTPIVEGDEGEAPADGSGDGGASRAPRFSGGSSSSSAASGASVSFEDSFEAEAREQFGDSAPLRLPRLRVAAHAAAAVATAAAGRRGSGNGAAAVARLRIECTHWLRVFVSSVSECPSPLGVRRRLGRRRRT
jgi:polyribonucleotide nucleotidyltransferase